MIVLSLEKDVEISKLSILIKTLIFKDIFEFSRNLNSSFNSASI